MTDSDLRFTLGPIIPINGKVVTSIKRGGKFYSYGNFYRATLKGLKCTQSQQDFVMGISGTKVYYLTHLN